MRDVTFCSSADCPSTECKIKVTNNNFEPGEVISVADFHAVCRFYVGWILYQIDHEQFKEYSEDGTERL